MFVTLEGVEGSGKSTLASNLEDAAAAEGVPFLLTAEPGGTELGSRIRRLLLEGDDPSPLAEALLFAADRAEHVETVIRPALAEGVLVLCDRFSDSTFAYQSDMLPLSVLQRLNSLATGGLRPDLTLLMDVPLQVALGRARDRAVLDRIEARPGAFHARVQERYRRMAAAEPERFRLTEPDADAGMLLAEILSARR